MKFCPIVPEICLGQIHGPRKERKKEKENNNNNKKRAKTISLQTLFGRLKYGDELCLKTFVTDGRTGQKQYVSPRREETY